MVHKASLNVSKPGEGRSDNWAEAQASWAVLIKLEWEEHICPEMITMTRYNSPPSCSCKTELRLLFNEAAYDELKLPLQPLSTHLCTVQHVILKIINDSKLPQYLSCILCLSILESGSLSSEPINIFGKL